MHYLKILFLIFFCQSFLNAQELAVLQKATDFDAHFPLENLSVSDGLFDNNIQDVLQDSYGFLWLAGMAGLQKYDGYTFKYYKPGSVNPAWQEAERLFEDSKKNLWVQLKEGLVRYDRESDNFVRYYFVNDQNDTIPYKVTAMAEDRDSVVWFWVHAKGLFRVDYSTNHFIADKKINTMYDYDLNNLVRCMVFDLENNLWIGTNSNGLIVINSGKDIQKKYEANPAITGSLSNNTVTNALCDLKGDLWFATNRGINLYNPEKDTFTGFFIDTANRQNEMNMIQRIADDGLGNIWTITNTVSVWGIGRFNKKNRQFQYSSVTEGWPNSLAIDRSGILWFGNRYQGLYKLDLGANKFYTVPIKKNGTDLLKDRQIQGICKDNNGDIWFGANPDGLYRFNPSTGDYSFYRLNRSQADSHNSNFILEIFQDSRGVLWIGTKSGLIRFNRQTGHFKLINPALSIYAGTGRTATIVEDAQGKLWLITINGMLIHFDPQSEKMEFFSVPDSKLSFRAIEMDPGGFLWIGSLNNGLFKFDISGNNFLSVKNIADKNISALHLQGDSLLWCATNADGLLRYNTYTKKLTVINEADGFLSNGILGMEQDKSGNLWLSSHRGLIRYNPRDHTFKNYFKEDGFLTNEFHYRGHYQDENGQMLFGSSHGLVTFHPDSIKDSDYKAPLVLTDIKINNKAVTPGSNAPLGKNISFSKEIILSHEQNDLSITFSSLDFSHPQRNEYAFYLENLEENWRPAGRERTAYYTNLDPGEYVFRVKGTNGDGLWNDAGTSLNIIILPPWWKTTWAYMTYGLLIFALFYAIRRYELNRQRLKLETENYREIDEMKSRFFANISHEFRTPLTLILGPLQKLLTSTKDKKSHRDVLLIQRNAGRLKQLIDQLLDLSRLDSGRMLLQTQPQDIVRKMRELVAAFMSLSETRNINFNFRPAEESLIVWFDPDKLEKIIFNLLGNAFKFTPDGGSIDVALGSAKGHMFITISDTGPGIPLNEKHHIFDRFYQAGEGARQSQASSGIGLALVKELVELHKGTITVDSTEGKGTVFTIKLPLGKDHLQAEEIIRDHPETEEALTPGDISLTEYDVTVSADTKPLTRAGRPAVLIVDDNPDMRRYISDCLEGGYNILQSDNGNSGLQNASDNMPDIIVSDVMMPEMDGFQFCNAVKTDERTSHIPVILLTAKASGDSKIEGLETGADDYLTKPFDKRELLVRVKNLIEQRRKLREKFRTNIIIQPGEITTTSVDEQFLHKALNAVEKHINDPDFDTTALSREVGASRMLLHTKLKALTGQTTADFIRTLRLKRAAQLLEQGSGNVSEIAYEVGFNNLSYFAKTFKKEFGKSPSQFVKE